MRWPFWFACACLFAFAPLRAEVVWSTVGSGEYLVNVEVGAQHGANRQWAVSFAPSTTCTLTSISLPLAIATTPGAMTLVLVADADGVPGMAIETFTATEIHATTPTLYTFRSALRPRLGAETRYWIVAVAASPASLVWPNTADVNRSYSGNREAFRENDGPWSVIWSPYIPGVVVLGSPSGTSAIASGTQPRMLF